MEHQKIDTRPVLLRADNFTPPSRTPWGGRWIRRAKARWVEDGAPVGEAWELSVEPSFPSRCDPRDEPLAARCERAPVAWLGREAALGGTSLLVKLLDAAEPLSVQIHPADGHPGLAPDEGGKPESWYVVAAEPGSGIHLGLAESASPEEVSRALDEDRPLEALLTFVPVEPGDFFVIEAGTPHCIGAGVTVVEPQRVRPGRKGVTYRYWDWGRRFDAQGRPDPAGRPRALHRDEALAVTRWDLPRGQALLRRVHVRAGAPERSGPASWLDLAGPVGSAVIAWDALRVARLSGTGALPWPAWEALCALTVLAGTVQLGGELHVPSGRTAAIPAAWRGSVELRDAHAIVAAVAV